MNHMIITKKEQINDLNNIVIKNLGPGLNHQQLTRISGLKKIHHKLISISHLSELFSLSVNLICLPNL